MAAPQPSPSFEGWGVLFRGLYHLTPKPSAGGFQLLYKLVEDISLILSLLFKQMPIPHHVD
jgi:hypothetical protein